MTDVSQEVCSILEHTSKLLKLQAAEITELRALHASNVRELSSINVALGCPEAKDLSEVCRALTAEVSKTTAHLRHNEEVYVRLEKELRAELAAERELSMRLRIDATVAMDATTRSLTAANERAEKAESMAAEVERCGAIADKLCSEESAKCAIASAEANRLARLLERNRSKWDHGTDQDLADETDAALARVAQADAAAAKIDSDLAATLASQPK